MRKTLREETTLYILTDPYRICEQVFKVGIHTGSYDQLINRYRTTGIYPIILGWYMPDEEEGQVHATCAENIIKEAFKDYRLKNPKGNLSEWIHYPFDLLVVAVECALFGRTLDPLTIDNIEPINASSPTKDLMNGTYEVPSQFRKYIVSDEQFTKIHTKNIIIVLDFVHNEQKKQKNPKKQPKVTYNW